MATNATARAEWKFQRFGSGGSHGSQRNCRPAYKHDANGFQWNLQIQRRVGTNQSVSIAYVGTHGAHLTRNYNANQQLFDSPAGTELFPNLGGSITTQDNRGKSDYHSLQAQYERRLTKGLQFLGSFTRSKTIDDACGAITPASHSFTPTTRSNAGSLIKISPTGSLLSSLYELPFGKGKHWAGNVSRPPST